MRLSELSNKAKLYGQLHRLCKVLDNFNSIRLHVVLADFPEKILSCLPAIWRTFL